MYAAATLWMNDCMCEDDVHTIMLGEIQVLCIHKAERHVEGGCVALFGNSLGRSTTSCL
jgi:hypothetical protein